MRIAVAGDILALAQPLTAWEKNFKPLRPTQLEPVIFAKDLLSDLGRNPATKATIIPLPSIESSFSCHIAKGQATSTAQKVKLIICDYA